MTSLQLYNIRSKLDILVFDKNILPYLLFNCYMVKYNKPYKLHKVCFNIEEITMKLLVVGSRSIKEYDLEKHVTKETTMIISGGAGGIDTLAEEYADKKRLSKLILRPQYSLYGRSAPLKRNEKMVELCDMALIIWDGCSKGTRYTINYANKIGRKIILITEE